MCAERNAIFQAVAQGALSKEQKIKAVVVVTPTDKVVAPCGARRQVIQEFGPDAEIFLCGTGAAAQQFKLSDLLPHAFGPKDLGEK
jgi:cytidine deaminase